MDRPSPTKPTTTLVDRSGPEYTALADNLSHEQNGDGTGTRSASLASPMDPGDPLPASGYSAPGVKSDHSDTIATDRRRAGDAPMPSSSATNIKLPGDLGANDPRRPRSPPAPSVLPGDLGPNDPRRGKSVDATSVPTLHRRDDSNTSDTGPPAGMRIMKDPKEKPEAEQSDMAAEDIDADNENDTEGETAQRGRVRKRPEPGRTTSGKSVNVHDESDTDQENERAKWAGTVKPDPTKGESKFSFQSHANAKPTFLSTKKRVHPSTAFDTRPPRFTTPLPSEDESHSELRAAQKMSLSVSNIHSTPSAHRVIRQIIRGDYAHFQREAEHGRKRQRMYLVATDLSPESEHALEWTVGTVLRDGDTLFAVYAVDGESGPDTGGGVAIGQGAQVVRDTAAICKELPPSMAMPTAAGPSLLSRGSAQPSPVANSGAEAERRRALEAITTRCVRLLRKTRLQVRVVVEVFHCKSPRHMITEVIDFLSPTLVIIGSRGRSAVKGVLLGSFSNYLVTKSSVPVMVARKKLHKHSKTNRMNRNGTSVDYSGSVRAGRFSNMIEIPKGTGLRVKGWEQVGID